MCCKNHATHSLSQSSNDIEPLGVEGITNIGSLGVEGNAEIGSVCVEGVARPNECCGCNEVNSWGSDQWYSK